MTSEALWRGIRRFGSAFAAPSLVAALIGPPAAAAGQAVPSVTFYKDVAPILRERCQSCHAPNEMAPMSLRSYEDARPWARAIRQKVSSREMPPWFIDRSVGIQKYKNDSSLTDQEIQTIVSWVDGGVREGNRADAPPAPPMTKAEGWQIGTPDLIVTKKPFKMYAQGSDWWQQELVDSGLTEDRWVKAVELRPGNRRIVHHYCSNPTSGPGGEGVPGVGAVPQDRYAREEREASIDEARKSGEGIVGARTGTSSAASIGGGGFGCYLPGNGAKFFDEGTGILMKAGSKVSFGMHYSAVGEEATDASSVGIVFYPKGVVPTQVVNSGFFQKFPAFELDIPPNTRTTSDAYMMLPRPTLLRSFTPHMHMRGSALVLEAIMPTGRVVTISGVKNYNFAWQLDYLYADDQAPLLPAGTMLHAIVIHDNTSANRHNPDPNRWVGYGQSSVEEMAGTFVSWTELSPEQYRERASARRAIERSMDTQQGRQ